MSGAVNVFLADHSQDPTGEAPDLTLGVWTGWCDGRCRHAWGLTFHVLAGRAASTLRVQDEHACVSPPERTTWVRHRHVCEPHQSCWRRCVLWRGHSIKEGFLEEVLFLSWILKIEWALPRGQERQILFHTEMECFKLLLSRRAK